MHSRTRNRERKRERTSKRGVKKEESYILDLQSTTQPSRGGVFLMVEKFMRLARSQYMQRVVKYSVLSTGFLACMKDQ